MAITYLDTPSALKVLANARAHAPQVPVVVRTDDDTHLEKLQAAGATEVVPEAIEGSLMLAGHALALVGVPMRRVLRLVQDQRERATACCAATFMAPMTTPCPSATRSACTPSPCPRAPPPWAPAWPAGAARHGRAPDQRAPGQRPHVRAPTMPPPLAEGDTLVLSGHPTALSLAEEKLLRG